MCYNEIASCVVMGGRHSFLTTPYGIGSLDCRGKETCITIRSLAVLSWVGDTHFLTAPYGIGSLDCRGPYAIEYPKWDWEPGVQRASRMCLNENAICVVLGGRRSFLTAPYGIGSLDCRGQ